MLQQVVWCHQPPPPLFCLSLLIDVSIFIVVVYDDTVTDSCLYLFSLRSVVFLFCLFLKVGKIRCMCAGLLRPAHLMTPQPS